MFRPRSRLISLWMAGAAGLACALPSVSPAATIDLGSVWAEVDVGSAVGFDTGWTWYTAGASRIAFGPGPVAGVGEIFGLVITDFALNIDFVAKPGTVITGYQVTGSGMAGQGPWSSAWMTGSFGAASVPNAFTESTVTLSAEGEFLSEQPGGGAPQAWSVSLSFGPVPSLSLAGTLGAESHQVNNWELIGSHQELVGSEPVYELVWMQIGIEPIFDWVNGQWEPVGEQPIFGWVQVLVGEKPIYEEVPDYGYVIRGTPAVMSLNGIDIQVTTVPEPQTWATFALGIGLLAWRLRRSVARRA